MHQFVSALYETLALFASCKSKRAAPLLVISVQYKLSRPAKSTPENTYCLGTKEQRVICACFTRIQLTMS